MIKQAYYEDYRQFICSTEMYKEKYAQKDIETCRHYYSAFKLQKRGDAIIDILTLHH